MADHVTTTHVRNHGTSFSAWIDCSCGWESLAYNGQFRSDVEESAVRDADSHADYFRT